MDSKYKILKSLASGSTGKVKMCQYLNKTYAIKIIDKSKKPEKDIKKEIKIHALLHHPNIVRLVDSFEDINGAYIVMDLAETELFDLIEPDEGLNPTLIHFYFRQLLSAVEYMHKMGIVHRDIKPENIMLSKTGNLLLTDFGFSTVFMFKGKRRMLNTLAGSYTYMAPEVVEGRYDESVDVWSMGILLLVLFTGMVGWSEPVLLDENFAQFMQMKYHNYAPFSKLSPIIYKLFQSMCCVNVKKRFGIAQLKSHEWIKKPSILEDNNGLCKNYDDIIDYLSPNIITRSAFSQPHRKGVAIGNLNIMASLPNYTSFDGPLLKRIYLSYDRGFLLAATFKILDSLLVPYNHDQEIVCFNTVDKSGNEMLGEIIFEKVGGLTCIDFTRVKGNCIEFKKLFNAFHDRIMSLENTNN